MNASSNSWPDAAASAGETTVALAVGWSFQTLASNVTALQTLGANSRKADMTCKILISTRSLRFKREAFLLPIGRKHAKRPF